MKCFSVVGLAVSLGLVWVQSSQAQTTSLAGVIDFHVHSGPDSRPRSVSDLEVARIAKRQLFGHGPFYPRVAVTDHHRSVGAEQVDVTVAVGVLYAATLGGRYEDRVAATAEQSRVLVSVNATGDYGQRSLVKSLALFETFTHGRPLISEVRRP